MAQGEFAWLKERGIQFTFHGWDDPPMRIRKSTEGQLGDGQCDQALSTSDLIKSGTEAMDDHYFETKMTVPHGVAIPPERFRTLQGAMTCGLPDGAYGSIWYQDEPEDAPVEIIRFNEDGTVVDAVHDDGSNYPWAE
jgi:hypothetical protein